MIYTPRLIPINNKHPNAGEQYTVDFSPWLETGETLTGIISTVADTGVTIGNSPPPVIAGTFVIFSLNGGTHGVTYKIRLIVMTTVGLQRVVNMQTTVIDPAL